MESVTALGLFRGIVTVVLFFAFCGVVIWAYSRKRRADFDAAARLPLDETPPGDAGHEEGATR